MRLPVDIRIVTPKDKPTVELIRYLQHLEDTAKKLEERIKTLENKH